MKSKFIYLTVSICSFTGVFVGTLGVLSGTNSANSQETTSKREPPVRTVEPPSNSEIFMTNLLASDLRVDSLVATVKSPVNNLDISLDFVGAISYDGGKLIQKDFTAISANGDLRFTLNGVSDQLSIYFPGNNKLYLKYEDHAYSVNVNSFGGILDLIPLITDKFSDTSAEESGGLDLSGLLGNATDLLNNIKEVETTEGYEYKLEIPDLATIILQGDKDNYLSGVKTDGNIVISDFEISLAAKVTSSKERISYVETPIDEEFREITKIESIVNTLTNVLNSNKLSANFGLNLDYSEGEQPINVNLNGKLGADITNVNNLDFENGTYEFIVNPSGTLLGSENKNSIKVHYQNSQLFLKLNNLVKAKFTNQNIQDIIDVVNKNLENQQIDLTSDLIEKILDNSIIQDLINGHYEKAFAILKDFSLSDSKATFVISKDLINLDEDFSLSLCFNDTDLLGFELKNVAVLGLKFDFTLNLESTFTIDSDFIESKLADFSELHHITTLIDDLFKIIDKKSFTSSYNISIYDTEKFYAVNGELSADLRDVNFDNIGNILDGKFKFTATTTVNNVSENIKLNVLNQNVYFNYNDIMKASVKISSITDIIDFISNKFEFGDIDLSSIFEAINFDPELYNSIINSVSNFDLTALDNVIKFEEKVGDENLFVVYILPDAESQEYVTLTLDLSNKLNSISLSNLKVGSMNIEFTLNITENQDIVFDDVTDYKPVDSLLYNVKDLIGESKFNLSVNGSINTDLLGDSQTITLGGKVQMDLDAKDFYGNIDLGLQLPIETKPYQHHLIFDDKYDSTTETSELLVKYYGNNNSSHPMRFNMYNNEFSEIIDVCSNISETNSLQFILDKLDDIVIEMPLLDIIDGDYDQIFGYYIKSCTIETNFIEIKIDGKLFGSEGNDISIRIDNSNEKLNSLSINNFVFDGTRIDLTVNVNNFDESYAKERLSVKEPKSMYTYFDFNYLDLFLSIGITTTESRSYHLQGVFDLTIPGLASLIGVDSVYANADLKLTILDDGHVNALITITATDSNHNAISQNKAGYRVTEFFIEGDDNCIIRQTKVYKEGGFIGIGAKTYKVLSLFKVTQAEMLNNIHYYLLNFTMGINQDLIFGAIDDAVANPTSDSSVLNIKYENIFTNIQYKPAQQLFTATVDLNSVIDLGSVTAGAISQGSVRIDVYHDDNHCLSRLVIEGNEAISIVGLFNIGLKLDVTHNSKDIFTMDYFNKFIESYYSNPAYSQIGFFEYYPGTNGSNNGAIYTEGPVQI